LFVGLGMALGLLRQEPSYHVQALSWTTDNYSFPPIISYSIDLTQSLYVSSMRSRAILWDIKSQKRLWEWEGETLNGYDWLTNGMGLIVAYQDFNSDTSRVTLVGRDGHVSELLNLKKLVPQAIISGIAMSPDENYFAAWVSSQEYSETHLMVANLRLQQIVDYCITPSNFYDMLWSPDSKYLLVSAPSVSGNRDSILVDIEHFYAARIASNTSPVGWLYTENKPRKWFLTKLKQTARIGAATAKSPDGPFTPQPEPIPGSFSIDPCVFVDEDGQAYIYFGGLWGGQLEKWQTGSFDPEGTESDDSEPALYPRVAKLSANMLSFDEPVQEISITDEKGRPDYPSGVVVLNSQQANYWYKYDAKHDPKARKKRK
jgi:hypothetical protein